MQAIDFKQRNNPAKENKFAVRRKSDGEKLASFPSLGGAIRFAKYLTGTNMNGEVYEHCRVRDCR